MVQCTLRPWLLGTCTVTGQYCAPEIDVGHNTYHDQMLDGLVFGHSRFDTDCPELLNHCLRYWYPCIGSEWCQPDCDLGQMC